MSSVTLPAVSVASTLTVCTPSGSAAPSGCARSGTWPHGAMRWKSHAGSTVATAAPSTSTRSWRMPTGSLAPKLSGKSSVRSPGSSSAPRAITAGRASSRTVTTEPAMLRAASGKPWSLAVWQPAGTPQAAE